MNTREPSEEGRGEDDPVATEGPEARALTGLPIADPDSEDDVPPQLHQFEEEFALEPRVRLVWHTTGAASVVESGRARRMVIDYRELNRNPAPTVRSADNPVLDPVLGNSVEYARPTFPRAPFAKATQQRTPLRKDLCVRGQLPRIALRRASLTHAAHACDVLCSLRNFFTACRGPKPSTHKAICWKSFTIFAIFSSSVTLTAG